MPNTSSFFGKRSGPAVVDDNDVRGSQVRCSPSPKHKNLVLASLPAQDFVLIARHLDVVSVAPGTVLLRQDHQLDYLYFPHEGLVSLFAEASDGQSMQVASIGRNGVICPILEANVPENFLSAVSMVELRASRIAPEQVQALLRDSETLRGALNACRHALLLQLRQNMVCSALHSAQQRLARWLLEAADRLETHADSIPITQEDIAHRLGIRRTTVTLQVNAVEEAGAIRWGRSRVEILDRGRLEGMACSCYSAQRQRMGTAPPANLAPVRPG